MITLRAKIPQALARIAHPSSDFDLNIGLEPRVLKLQDAAVLIALVTRPNGVNVVLTKRAAQLKIHPGQISFPGGKRDGNDLNIVATALREANEETGLQASDVQVLGQLPIHRTMTGFRITPIIGWVQQWWNIQPNPGEVEEVFEVPLQNVLHLPNFQVQSRHWAGHNRNYYVVPYGPYYIWGATARILRSFAELMDSS